MKIGIIGSMQFSDRMVEVATKLKALGHEPMMSLFVQSFLGKDAEEQEYYSRYAIDKACELRVLHGLFQEIFYRVIG